MADFQICECVYQLSFIRRDRITKAINFPKTSVYKIKIHTLFIILEKHSIFNIQKNADCGSVIKPKQA